MKSRNFSGIGMADDTQMFESAQCRLASDRRYREFTNGQSRIASNRFENDLSTSCVFPIQRADLLTSKEQIMKRFAISTSPFLSLVIAGFAFPVLAHAQTGTQEAAQAQTQLAQTQTAQMQTAQTQTAQMQNQGSPTVQAAAPVKKMGFRLTEWKTIHSHSGEEAKETIAALQKIGCEVTSDNHGNHIDVKYRCPEWKSLKLATDQLVNQWSSWCAAKGMETVVMNPPSNSQRATVQFRMATPRTVHLHDMAQANQIVNTLELIGCEVQNNQHGDHMDATFSCPQWQTIEVPSDANAHAWQKWLDESGFETQHSH